MCEEDWTIGIVGGTGMLGKAIALAVLNKQVVSPERLWISNRSGAASFVDYPALNVTTSNQELADASDVILLSVPPTSAPEISMDARDSLILSVMAGIPLDELKRITGTNRVIRAMSSPAAQESLAYSPWHASTEVTTNDRTRAATIFGACGLTDEVESEAHIECFTAMTGPVPGFVAFFAEAMVDYAIDKGIPPEVADRAIRQLFLGAGKLMSEGTMTPADHVRQMIDYAGTTAAGLEAMKRSSMATEIAEGLDASISRTRSIG